MSHRAEFESLVLSVHLSRLRILQTVAAQAPEKHGLLTGKARVHVLDILPPLLFGSAALHFV